MKPSFILTLFSVLLMVGMLFCLPAIASQPIGGDQGYFDISSSPSGASVYFDGQYKGITPLSVTVSTTGTPSHTIRLTLAGYQPWEQTYGNPMSGETINVDADLLYIPVTQQPTQMPGEGQGYYSISSSPSGAGVYFDNSYRGTTPLVVTVSSTGTPGHTIRVTLAGYQEWSATYPGNPADDQTIYVTANLVPSPSYGSISVDSTPSQATATLDGGSSQLTPCTFNNVYQGSHTIQITKSGYQPWSNSVSVSAGKVTYVSASLRAVAPETGSIYATSVPQGATVYVDGYTYGPSPQLASGLSLGMHQVRMSLSGFQDWVGQVQVTSGATTTVSQTLSVVQTPRPTVSGPTGSISVSSTPAGAGVYIDDVYMGITPVTIPQVAAGSHQVLLQLSGYADWRITAEVAAGQTTPVSATLSPAGPTQPTKGALSPVIALLSLAILAFAFWIRKN